MATVSIVPRIRAISWAVVLASACGGSTYLEDLKQPTIWWEQERGPCSFVRAVDANRDVWDDAGCENGRFTLDKVGAADQTKYRQVTSAATALPMPSEQSDEICNGGARHVFGVRRDGRETLWFACGSGREYGDLTGLSDPFLSLAQSMKDLP
jgi:hypothetical protein